MARAVRDAVLREFPEADLEVHIVWTHVLNTDGYEGALRSAKVFDDERVHQYHDPLRRVGQLFAPSIGMPSVRSVIERTGESLADWEEVFDHGFVHGPASVFDTVLFFAPGTEFAAAPESVSAWVTQLDPGVYDGVDATRFRFGDSLLQELEALTRSALPAPETGGDAERR